MKKILITGGAGNIGGALARKLVESQKYYVVVADNLSTGNKSKLPSKQHKNWSFVLCDINNYQDISELMLSYKFDYVFHYAAVVGVQRTLDNPVDVLKDIDGIKNILNLAKNTSVKRAFFSSSSEVYGEPVELPQNEETTPLNSRLPYAVVKNVGESFFRSYNQTYDLPFTIFRFFNTYGPNQSNDFVIPHFLKLALLNKNITVFGDGHQTRTFCYVDDNVYTCVKILENNLVINDVVNIGSSNEMRIIDLAEKLIQITNSKSKIIHLPPLPEGDMKRRQPDNSKMLKILAKPLISLEIGIQKMLDDENFMNYVRN
ncbi:MAG: NAD-dependent epimerase/dehydratase family protein [Bacteroidota bacterium]|nr:NAD-dependent epimerase/dehydratase family protein [Bacteroidota bacterium]